MAIIISRIKLKADTLGNVTPLFLIDKSDPINLTGTVYYTISDKALKSLNNVSWTELGSVMPTITLSNGERYMYASETMFFETIWGKHVYFRFVGEEDGSVITWQTSLSGSQLYSHESSPTNNFIKTGNNLTFSGFGANDIRNITYLQTNQFANTECIKKIEWKVTFLIDGVEVNKVVNYPITSSRIEIGNIPSTSNIYIKNVECKLTVTYQSEPIIVNQKLKYIAYIQSFEQKAVNIIDTKPSGVVGVHGSFIYGRYLYGCGRYDGKNNFVKINIDDSSDIQYLRIDIANPRIKLTDLEQILHDGEYMFALGSGGAVYYLVKVKMSDFTYNLYALDYRVLGVPIGLNDGFVYIHEYDAPHRIFKYEIASLNSTEIISPIPPPTAMIVVDNFVNVDYRSSVHSLVIDETHLYSAFTTTHYSTEIQPYEKHHLLKFNKSDLSYVGGTLIPQATDDMTDNEDFLFFGQEVINQNSEYGSKYGTFAVRKSDLEFFKLSYLSPSDVMTSSFRSPVSYASTIFGGNLIDAKTNHRIYNIDISRVEDWTDEYTGGFTLNEYFYPNSYGVINDFAFDFDTQTFHGFCWVSLGYSESNYIKFQLPDLEILDKPFISNVSYLFSNQGVDLIAEITSTGGTPITSSFFEIFDINDEPIDSVHIYDSTLGVKTVNYIPPSSEIAIKVRFASVNNVGTRRSDIVTINTSSPPSIVEFDYEVISPNNFSFNCGIVNNGGSVITSAYFEILSLTDDLLSKLTVTNDVGSKTAIYQATEDFKVKFVAINTIGIAESEVSTIKIVKLPVLGALTEVSIGVNTYRFECEIKEDGGDSVTEAFFEINKLDGSLIERISTSISIGNKVIEYTALQEFTVKFVANNIIGFTESNSKTLTLLLLPTIGSISFTRLDDNKFNIISSIISDGGSPITDAYFEVVNVNNIAVTNLDVSKSLGSKNVDYTSETNVKIRFTVINAVGSVNTTFNLLTVLIRCIRGLVYYSEDLVFVEGVTIYLVDLENNLITDKTVSDAEGFYTFDNLIKDKEYLVCGFQDSKRILSKVLKPIAF